VSSTKAHFQLNLYHSLTELLGC